jgi:L-ribulose-5-phosphate 4-epimerase
MLEGLKRTVLKANLDLVRDGLVVRTWGNASGIDRESGLVVIKPSGVSYDTMNEGDMVVIDLDGRVVEGGYRPSTDAPTHIYLYREYPSIGGVVHTHSAFATAWAQAGRDIPAFGTTHADHCYGAIPCTRKLTREEVGNEYELNTGKVIAERIGANDPLMFSSVLVYSHGPFCMGRDAPDAAGKATELEEIARMAYFTVVLGQTVPVDDYLLGKHFSRKHGRGAYYGQDKSKGS